jgi:hypothetical protein
MKGAGRWVVGYGLWVLNRFGETTRFVATAHWANLGVFVRTIRMGLKLFLDEQSQ